VAIASLEGQFVVDGPALSLTSLWSAGSDVFAVLAIVQVVAMFLVGWLKPNPQLERGLRIGSIACVVAWLAMWILARP
jgi:hypothetical protein